MLQIKSLSNKIKENYWQLFLIVILLFQNKIILDTLSIEAYGSYVLQISIGGIISLIFPLGFGSYIRKSLIANNLDIIEKYFSVSFIFSVISSIAFIIGYYIFKEKLFIFYFIFYLSNIYNYYDVVLITYDEVNKSRLLLFLQSLTFLVLLLILPNLNFSDYLIIFSLSALLRSILGWLLVKKYIFKSLKYQFQLINYEDRKYIFKISLSDYLNSSVSHLESIIIGNMSTSKLGIFQLHKVIPNAIKSNIKLLFIKDQNKMLRSLKVNYLLNFNDFVKHNSVFFVLTLFFSVLSTYFYIDIFLNSNVNTSIVLSTIISTTIIFKVLNSFLSNHNLILQNGDFYFKFNFYNKIVYILALFLAILFSKLIFVSLVILLNDLIIFLVYYTRIKLNN